ncbi:MAG: hypothetical protein COC06_09855 [Bacteroidales bacterium]|nr:MAG: hypothetical protein COC06_09855 [Bacteroidales bacterium]
MIKKIIKKLYLWGTRVFIWGTVLISVVMILRFFVFDVYYVPTGSMNHTIKPGELIVANKMKYGARWFCGEKVSRLPGTGSINRNDIVVFNFPEGDTIYKDLQGNYYEFLRAIAQGKEVLTGLSEREKCYIPMSSRQPYVKRCVGMPGDTLKIREGVVFCNSKFMEGISTQINRYRIEGKQQLVDSVMGLENIEGYWKINKKEEFAFYATEQTYSHLIKRYSNLVIKPLYSLWRRSNIFPFHKERKQCYSYDEYGPVYIPAQGDTIVLSKKNLLQYLRLIKVYENNSVELKGDEIIINGNKTERYVVKQNYYFMMGDNRYCSIDSRSWGFVPEDHIIGKTQIVLFSKLPDGQIRWNRIGFIE